MPGTHPQGACHVSSMIVGRRFLRRLAQVTLNTGTAVAEGYDYRDGQRRRRWLQNLALRWRQWRRGPTGTARRTKPPSPGAVHRPPVPDIAVLNYRVSGKQPCSAVDSIHACPTHLVKSFQKTGCIRKERATAEPADQAQKLVVGEKECRTRQAQEGGAAGDSDSNRPCQWIRESTAAGMCTRPRMGALLHC